MPKIRLSSVFFSAVFSPFSEFRYQQFYLKSLDNMGATASPIALLVVGATFEGRKALAKIRPSLVATLIKLVIIPAIFFPFAILFGFRNSELVAILVMLGSPTTVSCYIMAKNMKNDAVLTSSIVVLATLLSSISLTAWIFILRSFGLI
ncbi:MAG: AEC family transporter [Frisingicoccus sp.]